MIQVFITDIQNNAQSDRVLNTIQNGYNGLRINLDLNETEFPFPCGHTILRVEGSNINSEAIMVDVRGLGFNCEILEDKICSQKERL